MKKNIYVHGSFMNDNFGDFLLYEAIMNELERYKKEYYIYSADVSNTYDPLYPVNRKSKIKSIFSADLAVFGGGGYFGEPDKLKLYWSLKFLIRHAVPLSVLRMRGVPYAILGVGVGPLSFSLPRLLAKYIFKGAKEISVRDNESMEYLRKIGVKNEIRVVPDWVMSMDESDLVKEQQVEDKNELTRCFDNTKKNIFVHLSTKNHQNGQGLSLVIDELVKFAQSQKEINFIIGCDQAGQTQEVRAQEIVNKLPKERTKLLKYQGPRLLCSAINKSDIVITDKLHVGIVGTRLHKKVLAFASHSKTLRFYRQIGSSEYAVHLKNVDKELVNNLFNNVLEASSVNILENINKARENKNILHGFIKASKEKKEKRALAW